MLYGTYDTWSNIYRSLRENPDDLCAGYNKLMAYKSRYISAFGQSQLEQDYKLARERSRV